MLSGGNWPQWRGPDRTNVSTETGLLKEWPEGGPPLAWKASGLGEGVPSVAIAGGKIFVLGYREGKEFLTALAENDGSSLWSTEIGEAVKEMPRMRWLLQRTPTVDGERVYAFRANGELVCLGSDGKVRWRKDYVKEFEARRPVFGYADYPLVDGDKLICTPGGEKATVVALNKSTGEIIWTCLVPRGDSAAYAAAVVAEVGGVRQYVNFLSKGVVAVSAEGKFLWRYDGITNRTVNVYTPIVRGDRVFCASGYDTAFSLIQLVPEGDSIKAREMYTVRKLLQPWLSSAILVDDRVYLCCRGGIGPIAVDFKTGKILWEAGASIRLEEQASLVYADGHLYFRTASGKVVLARITTDGLVKKSEFVPPRSPSDEPTWTFPVIAGGRLYLRDQDMLLCYDLREKKVRRKRPDVIFVPTPQDVVEKMLELVSVKKEDVVADLGCGDGRIVITAAKKYGCKALGYDLDKECVRLALESVKKEGVERLVRIECQDILEVDLSGFSVVTLYLGPVLNAKLIPQLEKLKPGSRIVSHAFDIPGIKPDKVTSFTSMEDDVARKLYVWTTPLRKEPKKD
jgi:outer membrane protein assembly factor BamB